MILRLHSIQISVSEKHGIIGQAEEDLFKLGGVNKLLVTSSFALPLVHQKTPKSIEQYALVIPFPEWQDIDFVISILIRLLFQNIIHQLS